MDRRVLTQSGINVQVVLPSFLKIRRRQKTAGRGADRKQRQDIKTGDKGGPI